MTHNQNKKPLQRSSPLLNERSRLRHWQFLGREAWHQSVGVAGQEEFVVGLEILEPSSDLRLEVLWNTTG